MESLSEHGKPPGCRLPKLFWSLFLCSNSYFVVAVVAAVIAVVVVVIIIVVVAAVVVAAVVVAAAVITAAFIWCRRNSKLVPTIFQQFLNHHPFSQHMIQFDLC